LQADNWPSIVGITDNADLLNGDLPLLVSILERLFNEFHDVEAVHTQVESQRLALAARIHKLRGSAGLIGAQELYQLAGESEIALRNNGSQINPLLEKVAQSLINLRVNSAEFLSQQQDKQNKQQQMHVQKAPPLSQK
jgi:HPt (histidine-containing phosphotransfer) domain-containing protein